MITGVKTISDVRVEDTITSAAKPAKRPLPGFKDVKPVVFSSIYPVDTNDYEELVDALDRLKLNDASLVYEKDSSAALGFGFRCGFWGCFTSRWFRNGSNGSSVSPSSSPVPRFNTTFI